MIELTLLTLLNYVGDNFCEYRNVGHDNYKSLLLSYSDASEKFGPLEVKKVIEKSSLHFKKLSKLTNQTTKQKMWDLCREIIK